MNDYLNRSYEFVSCDKVIAKHISRANAYLFLAETEKHLDPVLAAFDRMMTEAMISVAKQAVSWAEEQGFIDFNDWSVIDHWLIWFGCPVEDRDDSFIH